jgi:hypothetical protein
MIDCMLGDPEALRHLSRRHRREALRSVRHGRVVDDPRLASSAIGYARSIQTAARRWSWRTPAGWPSLLASFFRQGGWLLPLVGIIALLAVFHDWVTAAAFALLLLMLAWGLVRHARELPRRAHQSEIANLQLDSPGSPPPSPRAWLSLPAQVIISAIVGLGVLDALVVAALGDWGSLLAPAVIAPVAIAVVLLVDRVVRGVRHSQTPSAPSRP